MKLRSAKYAIKEGIINVYKNRLMSFASICIVTASIIIFGIFFILSGNINLNIEVLKQQPEMEAFCNPELDDAQINRIEADLNEYKKIAEIKKITKEEAFKRAKEILGSKESLMEGEDESFLPVSFVIKLKNSEESSRMIQEIKSIEGIESVRYSQDAIDFISKSAYWVKVSSILLLLVFLLISYFIISNAIKLTVFARRKEINIMKYIGATDGFIRMPFIIEGIIIGFVGAVLALVLVLYGYTALEGKISSEMSSVGADLIQLQKTSDIALNIIGMNLLLGTILGAVGSAASLRKYLHV